MSDQRQYAIVICWSDQDDGYVADVPNLISCSALGDIPEEAFVEVRLAMEGWLATARANGHPIPAPRFRSAQSAAGGWCGA